MTSTELYRLYLNDRPAYHRARAEGHNRVAQSYRQAAAEFLDDDTDMAGFAMERAVQNEIWRDDELKEATA